jgi:hypothetical protein
MSLHQNYIVKEHTDKKRGQLSFPAIAIGGRLSELLATDEAEPVGGTPSVKGHVGVGVSRVNTLFAILFQRGDIVAPGRWPN